MRLSKKSESELQVVRKTLGLIVQQQKAGIQLDFSSIKKKVLASRPACGNRLHPALPVRPEAPCPQH